MRPTPRHLTALVALALPIAAHAWWNAQWTYRKNVTIDTSPTGVTIAAPVQNVPVLVRLHTGNFGYFLDVADGGKDLRFMSADDKAPLAFHIERFDAINEMALAWVKVPTVTPGQADASFRLYYGNQTAPPAQDPGATWDADEALVYHFADAIGQSADATAYANNPLANTAQPNPASLIGAGAQFAGAESITVPDSPSLRLMPDTGWTFSTWIKIDAPGTAPAVVFERRDGDNTLALRLEGTALVAAFNGTQTDPAPANLTAGAWQHVALVAGGGRLALYLDGQEVAQVPVALVEMGGETRIGAAADGTGFLTASLDEVRISKVARSVDWLRLQALGQGANAVLLGYGPDETQESAEGGAEAHGGYFGIIIQNVFGRKEAIVEQVVIGFCGLMGAVAVMVMVLKGMFLFRCRRATRRFLRAFDGLGVGAGGGAQALDALYESRTFRDSPLFRVYQQGIEEVKRRVHPSAGAAATGLDEKGLNSVRAAMDAVMVREGQRLNSQMVLLTIAISGGPFVGLLGTVVGVMVTFAAIAATGDVNITAIAPGMAAALLATVAGLGVAIPSLFGYNYLGSLVKEVSADMHVFADELVARINETYGA